MAAKKPLPSFTVPEKRKIKQALREMHKTHKAMQLKLQQIEAALNRGNFIDS
jgi:hypothetical protein